MADVPLTSFCPSCGTQLAPGLLACPGCRRLLFAERLKQLAAAADSAETGGDVSMALENWRTALTLVPADTRQAQAVLARIERLSRAAESGRAPSALPPPPQQPASS